MTQELIISEAAGARYMRAWESFVEALKGGEHISFSAFRRNVTSILRVLDDGYMYNDYRLEILKRVLR